MIGWRKLFLVCDDLKKLETYFLDSLWNINYIFYIRFQKFYTYFSSIDIESSN